MSLSIRTAQLHAYALHGLLGKAAADLKDPVGRQRFPADTAARPPAHHIHAHRLAVRIINLGQRLHMQRQPGFLYKSQRVNSDGCRTTKSNFFIGATTRNRCLSVPHRQFPFHRPGPVRKWKLMLTLIRRLFCARLGSVLSPQDDDRPGHSSVVPISRTGASAASGSRKVLISKGRQSAVSMRPNRGSVTVARVL